MGIFETLTQGGIGLINQLYKGQQDRNARLTAEKQDVFPHLFIHLGFTPSSWHTDYSAEVELLGKSSILLFETKRLTQPAHPYERIQITSRDGSTSLQFKLTRRNSESADAIGCIAALGQAGETAKIRVIVRDAATGKAVARNAWTFPMPQPN